MADEERIKKLESCSEESSQNAKRRRTETEKWKERELSWVKDIEGPESICLDMRRRTTKSIVNRVNTQKREERAFPKIEKRHCVLGVESKASHEEN